MDAKLFLKTIFLIVVLLFLVLMGMENRGEVEFALKPLLSQRQGRQGQQRWWQVRKVNWECPDRPRDGAAVPAANAFVQPKSAADAWVNEASCHRAFGAIELMRSGSVSGTSLRVTDSRSLQ